MAFEEYDDYEQEQLVKEWLNNNWFTIVAGIALGIGGLWGYGQWQNANQQKNQDAAVEFDRIEQVLAMDEVAEAQPMIAEYEASFGSNIYAIKARLMIAEKLVADGDLAAAKAEYRSIIEAKPARAIAEMTRIRLARLLLSEGEYTQASAQLDQVQSKAYQTVVEEIIGDIHLAQGAVDKAKDAYQLALNEGEGYSGRQIIEMKIADIKTAQ
jgi:predicted negative regulator of RcsB-dependent stress response